MKRRLLIGSGIAVAVAAAGFFTWYQLVKAGVLRYNEFDRRERGALGVGGPAPDLALTMYDGSALRLAELWREKPAFLVFGSCT
ncbi:MAG TPA: hypothetical protein VFM88_19080 [Vicinamibacteria bacterium]|nr:hypothetical protein [Vicinamibacteria bacterium]